MNKKKYYLGLDLGISSVGWAVMTKKENEYYIDDFGVRLFDCSEDPTDGTTHAEARRNFRSTRRLNRRRKQRINELKTFLEKSNIISKVEVEEFFKTFKITNNIEYDETKYFNPYVIRVKGLTEKLTPNELAVALINIANHRGYNDKFSFGDEKENKKSKLSESIDKAEIITKQHHTIAQAILNDPNFRNSENENSLGLIHNKIKKTKETEKPVEEEKDKKPASAANYRYLFARDDYKKELEQILKTQAEFYPQLASTQDKIINDIILRQRDFEVGPGPKDKAKKDLWKSNIPKHQLFKSFLESEGKCTFYPQEPRGYRCSLTFEIFRFVSDFSTFTARSLSSEEIIKVSTVIFDNLNKNEILDKTSLKKIIKENTKINIDNFSSTNKAWGELKINFPYLKLLNELLPNEFKTISINNLPNHIFNKLGQVLHENITPARRKEKLQEFFNQNKIILTEKQIEKFLGMSSSTSTSNASFKYMEEAIHAFAEQGKSYGNFQADFNKENEEKMFSFNFSAKLFQPIQDPDLQKNAVVFRAVNQARKVIKALHKRYRYFEVINVEVARELAKSFKERNKMKNKNEISFNERIEIEQELETNNVRANSINVKKYRLWKQQNQKCIYCKDHHDISLSDFKNSQIDHIIPQSKIADDSNNNLVLVCAKANQEKTNQTPLQWLSNDKEHRTSFINFCNKVIRKNISDKKYEYLMTKDLDADLIKEFASRNLNDTRYITRYITNWLKGEFKNWEQTTGEIIPTQVQSINGAVTSRFRRIWLQGSPWGLDEKVREITPYHHAVDAMILTQFISVSYVNFASDAANIINLKRQLYKGFINQVDFEKTCQEILAKWKIDKLRFDLGVRLEKLINKKVSEFKVMAPLVPNLKDTIENRIPVILDIKKAEKESKIKNIKKEISVPTYVEVLNQEEYYEKMKSLNLKGYIHYPFISYKINYKLSGPLTSSQLPVNYYEIKKDKHGAIITKTNRLDLNGNLKSEYSESYIKDSHNTLWEINNYYGVVFDEKNEFTPIWIRRIEATKEELTKYKDQNILVLRTIVEYYDKKKDKKVLKIFNGKMGTSIYTNLLGTSNITNLSKSKETFKVQNYYDSIINWKQDFKILKPNILGKVVTK